MNSSSVDSTWIWSQSLPWWKSSEIPNTKSFHFPTVQRRYVNKCYNGPILTCHRSASMPWSAICLQSSLIYHHPSSSNIWHCRTCTWSSAWRHQTSSFMETCSSESTQAHWGILPKISCHYVLSCEDLVHTHTLFSDISKSSFDRVASGLQWPKRRCRMTEPWRTDHNVTSILYNFTICNAE